VGPPQTTRPLTDTRSAASGAAPEPLARAARATRAPAAYRPVDPALRSSSPESGWRTSSGAPHTAQNDASLRPPGIRPPIAPPAATCSLLRRQGFSPGLGPSPMIRSSEKVDTVQVNVCRLVWLAKGDRDRVVRGERRLNQSPARGMVRKRPEPEGIGLADSCDSQEPKPTCFRWPQGPHHM
jgi:hypothetical protein